MDQTGAISPCFVFGDDIMKMQPQVAKMQRRVGGEVDLAGLS
jgi:hypothetical protein